MPTNASPEFGHAEKKFYSAKTDEEKLVALEEMIRTMPQHKSAEALRANLRTRYKKLEEKLDSKKKSKSGRGKEGIRKGEMQAVLIGLTNSGKSEILSALTNAKPLSAQYEYTTTSPFLGTLDYGGVKIQIIDMPAIESDFFDFGVANTADTLLIIINSMEDIEKIIPLIERAYGKKIYVLNKIDLLNEKEKIRIEARLRTKKLNFVLFSAKTKQNLNDLKNKIWESFDKIRVYTKEPGKKPDNNPVIMEKNSTIKEVANKIFHGLASRVKETKITGPSSKFPHQKIGIDHILKDKDIVEFRT